MSGGAGGRLHWLIAWRHLRAGEQATFAGPLALIAVYLIVVGLGFAGYASIPEPSLAAISPPPLEFMAPPPPLSASSYYGLVGGVTLCVGVMMLLGGLLARFFTVLATVIIISVMLGCMALVVVLSLMTGLELELRDKILGQLAHIQIAREDGRPFHDYASVVAAVRAAPGVVGASPYLQGEVMVRNGLNRQGGILNGIVPELHAEVSELPKLITEGAYRYLDEPEAIPDPGFSFEILEGAGAAPVVEHESAGAAGEREDDDDGDGWEDPVGALGGGSKGASALPLPPPVRFARDLAAEGSRGDLQRAVEAAAEDGWEDPEVEIARLRAGGLLPTAAGAGAPARPEGEVVKLSDPPDPAGAPGETDDADAEPAAIPGSVLIGSEKARELVAHVGDRVQLITPIGRSTPAGRIPGVMSVRVAGIFDANHYEYDRWLVYAPLPIVQAFLRTGDRISGVEVKIDDIERIRERRDQLRSLLAADGRGELMVRDWQELNQSLFSAMALEKIAVFIALLCVILVASFGILGSNLMSVLEKSKEIAILKTMGCTDSLILRVFIAEGLCMGIVGAILGIVTGIALCLALDAFGLPLSGELGSLDRLPVSIDPLEVIVVGVSALLIVWLSSLYPARVASRMRPAQALRKAEA